MLNSIRIVFSASVFFSSFIHCFAQDTPELITDRPDQTESSVVVPKGALQIETGSVFECNDENINQTKTFTYNTTVLRYGLLERAELRLGFEYLEEKDFRKRIDSTIRIGGFGPLSTGFKAYIAEENGLLPEIAFLGGLVLPFTANQDLRPDEIAANLRFSFSHTLSERLSLGYNLGIEWDGETVSPGYFYSIALGYGITDRLGAFVESYGLLLPGNTDEHLIDAGLTYLLLNNL